MNKIELSIEDVKLIIDLLNRGFYENAFGILHNDACDVLCTLEAAVQELNE